MARMTGARFIAETVHGHGIDHVFFRPYIAPRALMEMEKLGIKRIQTHGEKAAAYMADGYARVRRGPGLCMAHRICAWPSFSEADLARAVSLAVDAAPSSQ